LSKELKQRTEIDDKYKWNLNDIYADDETFETELELVLKKVKNIKDLKMYRNKKHPLRKIPRGFKVAMLGCYPFSIKCLIVKIPVVISWFSTIIPGSVFKLIGVKFQIALIPF